MDARGVPRRDNAARLTSEPTPAPDFHAGTRMGRPHAAMLLRLQRDAGNAAAVAAVRGLQRQAPPPAAAPAGADLPAVPTPPPMPTTVPVPTVPAPVQSPVGADAPPPASMPSPPVTPAQANLLPGATSPAGAVASLRAGADELPVVLATAARAAAKGVPRGPAPLGLPHSARPGPAPLPGPATPAGAMGEPAAGPATGGEPDPRQVGTIMDARLRQVGTAAASATATIAGDFGVPPSPRPSHRPRFPRRTSRLTGVRPTACPRSRRSNRQSPTP